MSKNYNIPKHWQVKKLGEVLKVSSGKGLKINLLRGGNYPVYGGNGINGYHSEYLIENPKLIIGRVGAKCGVTYITKPKSWVTDNALIVEPIISDFDLKFFQLKLGYENLNKLSVSTAQPVISGSKIYEYKILLPPLPEQQAIVSKIEELLSDLDNSNRQLQIAQSQLKIYRQSLLKWAFEGKLTNKDVKEGELPKGWEWMTLGDVCTKIGDIDHKMPKQLESGYPYVSTKDFTDNLKISFDHAKYISEEDYLNLSRKIKHEKGDIIFPRYGTIGKNVLVDFNKEFLVYYSCAVVKPNHNLVLSKYVYLFTLSPKITEEIRKYTVETTQANVGIASIKSFVFPLPSKEPTSYC